MWCIPPKANAEFVWKMEDVLHVYKRPYDPLRPVVCMDETSKQLIRETRLPVDVAPGQPRRVDYEYERKGVADLFMFFEPLRSWRRMWITPQRRKVEWAWCVQQLLDEHYPEAEPWSWSATTSIPTRVGPCTRRFPPPRRGGCGSDWRFTTPPSTAVG